MLYMQLYFIHFNNADLFFISQKSCFTYFCLIHWRSIKQSFFKRSHNTLKPKVIIYKIHGICRFMQWNFQSAPLRLDKPVAALIIHQKLMSLSFTREKCVIPCGRHHFGILVLVGVPQVLSLCLYGQHQTGDGSQQAHSAVHRQGQIQREAAHHLEPKQDVHE